MNSLILYFSRANENFINDDLEVIEVGNAEVIAKYLHSLIGGDIHKVLTKNEYPFSYKECYDLVKIELKIDARPGLLNRLNSVDKYDVIYIVSPIWCRHMPMALLNQLESLNFKNKKVRLITTYDVSLLGECLNDIKNNVPSLKIHDTYCIKGSNINKDEFKKWVGVLND